MFDFGIDVARTVIENAPDCLVDTFLVKWNVVIHFTCGCRQHFDRVDNDEWVNDGSFSCDKHETY